jgi:hypothetical protein
MKRTAIQANPNHADQRKRFRHEIVIVLGDVIEQEYYVVAKDFPDHFPDSWIDPDDKQRKRISWISNFGLKRQDGTFAYQLPAGKKYQIELPGDLRTPVYFDGKSVQKLSGQVEGKKFIAHLDLGDPPIGEAT